MSINVIHHGTDVLVHAEPTRPGEVFLEILSADGSSTSLTHAELQALAVDLNAYLAGPGLQHLTHNAAGVASVCDSPPAGWRCTRQPGHDGPCAAVPE